MRRFLIGGCGELASSLSYGMRTVVLRFFMGPCEAVTCVGCGCVGADSG